MSTQKISFYVALIVLSVIAVPVVYALVTNSAIIGSIGSVKAVGVGVYWDSSCTNGVSSMDWSIIEAGSSQNKTVYIKNTGNAAATLSLDTANWNPPSASDHISLAWDYDSQPIAPDAVDEVILTLTISSSISGITNFSFDIIISASS